MARWSAVACFVLSALALAGAPTHGASDDDGLPSPFSRVSPEDADAAAFAFASQGSTLAWASPRGDAIHIVVTDLATGEERAVTELDSSAKIRSLAFDGRWVVWSDDRFGNLDVFAADAETGRLHRLSSHPRDDAEVAVDGGRVVWVRDGTLHGTDLATGQTRVLSPGPAYTPQVGNGWVVWSQLEGQERCLYARSWNGTPTVILRTGQSLEKDLSMSGGVLAWRSTTEGPEGSPPTVAVVAATLPPASSDDAIPPPLDAETLSLSGERPVAGPGRVAWLEGTPVGWALHVESMEEGPHLLVPAPSNRLALSEGYLVAAYSGEASAALYAVPWGEADRIGQASEDGASDPAVRYALLLLVPVAAFVGWRLWRRRRRTRG